jgi:hypothetical protein
MTRSNARSKFIAATLAAVTLAGAVVATSGDA